MALQTVFDNKTNQWVRQGDIADWLREAAFIRRNASWMGPTEVYEFLRIQKHLVEHHGFSYAGFDAWIERINRSVYQKFSTMDNRSDNSPPRRIEQ